MLFLNKWQYRTLIYEDFRRFQCLTHPLLKNPLRIFVVLLGTNSIVFVQFLSFYFATKALDFAHTTGPTGVTNAALLSSNSMSATKPVFLLLFQPKLWLLGVSQSCLLCGFATEERRDMMKHLMRDHPGRPLHFRETSQFLRDATQVQPEKRFARSAVVKYGDVWKISLIHIHLRVICAILMWLRLQQCQLYRLLDVMSM